MGRILVFRGLLGDRRQRDWRGLWCRCRVRMRLTWGRRRFTGRVGNHERRYRRLPSGASGNGWKRWDSIRDTPGYHGPSSLRLRNRPGPWGRCGDIERGTMRNNCGSARNTFVNICRPQGSGVLELGSGELLWADGVPVLFANPSDNVVA